MCEASSSCRSDPSWMPSRDDASARVRRISDRGAYCTLDTFEFISLSFTFDDPGLMSRLLYRFDVMRPLDQLGALASLSTDTEQWEVRD